MTNRDLTNGHLTQSQHLDDDREVMQTVHSAWPTASQKSSLELSLQPVFPASLIRSLGYLESKAIGKLARMRKEKGERKGGKEEERMWQSYFPLLPPSSLAPSSRFSYSSHYPSLLAPSLPPSLPPSLSHFLLEQPAI